MQLTTIALLLASSAAIVSGLAFPAAEPGIEARQCGRPGQPCWIKVKRDAIPEPEILEVRDCGNRPGEPCWVKVKRDLLEVRDCGNRPGEPCWVKLKKREAEAEAEPELVARQCDRPGEPCSS